MPSDHRPVDPARAAVATVFGLVLVLLGGLMIWRKLWEARARLPAAPRPPIHRRTRPPARQEHQYPMTRILVLAFSTLVLLSGFSCFLLEKDWFNKIPPRAKAPPSLALCSQHALAAPQPAAIAVPLERPRERSCRCAVQIPMYMMLGISLCFAVSFSLVRLHRNSVPPPLAHLPAASRRHRWTCSTCTRTGSAPSPRGVSLSSPRRRRHSATAHPPPTAHRSHGYYRLPAPSPPPSPPPPPYTPRLPPLPAAQIFLVLAGAIAMGDAARVAAVSHPGRPTPRAPPPCTAAAEGGEPRPGATAPRNAVPSGHGAAPYAPRLETAGCVACLRAGASFGFMFGAMDVEDDDAAHRKLRTEVGGRGPREEGRGGGGSDGGGGNGGGGGGGGGD